MSQVEYWVDGSFRPGVIANAAKDSGFDATMEMSSTLLLLVVRPIKKELNVVDVHAFENRLRLGQVEFYKR